MPNIMDLNLTKFDPKILTFSVLDLETSYWQFMFKNLIKPLVQNPSFNFYKGDFILCTILR